MRHSIKEFHAEREKASSFSLSMVMKRQEVSKTSKESRTFEVQRTFEEVVL